MFFFFLLFCFYSRSQNLICNGDFQSYQLTQSYTGLDGITFYSTQYPPNRSCWYSKPSYKLQIQNQSKPEFLTKVVQLSDYYGRKYAICQKVVLVQNELYFITLNHIMPSQVKYSSTFLFINSVLVKKGVSKNDLISENLTYYFTADRANNQLCINGTVQHTIKSLFSLDDKTPLIDNVSLSKIDRPNNSSFAIPIQNTTNITSLFLQDLQDQRVIKTVNVNFILTTDQMQGFVRLTSVIPMSIDLFQRFKAESLIYIQNQKQQKIVSSYDIQSSTIQIVIYVERSYNLTSLTITVPESFSLLNIQFRLQMFINGKQVNIYFLSENLISALKTVEKYSNAVIQGVNYSYMLLRAFFLSYFIMNIINFYTLTLMYNFLMLKGQPLFSHIALQKLSKIFFVRNSLIKFIQNATNSNIAALNFSDFVDSSEGRERIEKLSGGFSWFGDIGMTYNYLQNNIQSLILILILLFKLTLGYLISSKLCHSKNLKKQKYIIAFFLQIIILSPTINTSAIQTLLQPGSFNIKQKINFFFHLITFFVLLFLCFLCFIYLHQSQKLTKAIHNSNDRINKKVKQDKKRLILKPLNQLISWSLNFVIPSLVSIRSNTGFFSCVSILLGCNLIIFCIRITKKGWKKHLFNGLKIMIFIIHHICFFIFYLSDKIDQPSESGWMDTLQKCGIAVVFTVVIGGLLQILQFLFQLLRSIYRLCRKIWLKVKRSKNEDKKKGEDKQKVNKLKPCSRRIQSPQDYSREINGGVMIIVQKIKKTNNVQTKMKSRFKLKKQNRYK